MLTIGDFSRLSRVTIKALRYYDEIGLLKPAQVDKVTGYRYYLAGQLSRLNRIVVLKNLGLSLDEVSTILDNGYPADFIRKLLTVKLDEIKHTMMQEKERLDQVEGWLMQIEKEGVLPMYDVVLKKLDKQNVVSLRRTIPTYADINLIFTELFGYVYEKKGQPVGPPIAMYHDPEYKDKDPDIEVALPVKGNLLSTDRIKVYKLPEVESAACTVHKGPYDKVSDAYNAMMAWLDKNRYQIKGVCREVYLAGPETSDDPKNYVTEVQFPVVKI
jgi:effector-binding domain-containing protein